MRGSIRFSYAFQECLDVVIGTNCWRLVAAVASTVALLGAVARADDASDIQQFYPAGSYAQYDNLSGDYPVITAIGSQPGTFGGHVYTGWSVFAQDSTGSLDLFISSATLTTLTGNAGATLNVGDKLNVAGQWSPFQQVAELGFVTAPASNNYFNTISTGNALPAPPVYTVSQINTIPQITSSVAFVSGTLVELKNVTIFGTNGLLALPSYTNDLNQETFTMTDNTGSTTFFDWTTSYSAATQLAGTPIGTNYTYNVFGFTHAFGTTTEFTALSMEAVPEPSSIVLVVGGLLGLVTLRRRRG